MEKINTPLKLKTNKKYIKNVTLVLNYVKQVQCPNVEMCCIIQRYSFNTNLDDLNFCKTNVI